MVSSVGFSSLAAQWGRVQAQQQLMVAAGLRPACRLRINREKLPLMAEVARNLSIKLVIGFDAAVAKKVPGRCDFSEWSHRVSLSAQELGDCYVYLCARHRYGQQLRRHDEVGDDTAVGELLGYPNCCVKMFGETCGLGEGDPVISMYGDDKPIVWPMNVSLLCFGHALLSHVPCAATCKASISLAGQYYDFLKSAAPRRATELKRMLSGWILHTDVLGVVAFAAVKSRGSLRIKSISSIDPESVIGRLVGKGSVIRRDDDGVVVDSCHLNGSQTRLFQFV
jgi:hypothetical protein